MMRRCFRCFSWASSFLLACFSGRRAIYLSCLCLITILLFVFVCFVFGCMGLLCYIFFILGFCLFIPKSRGVIFGSGEGVLAWMGKTLWAIYSVGPCWSVRFVFGPPDIVTELQRRLLFVYH
jgi:hypothetical protein